MDWSSWRPREETLTSIKELLQDALIPDSEIQKDVQNKLKNLEIVEDFTYYLLYIVGQTHFSEEIRSLSGILLKNNIAAVYNKLPQDSISKIRQLCLMLLRDPCRDVRTSISNVIYTLAKHSLNTWPELIPFLVKSFETPDEYGEVALTTLFSVCEEMMNVEKSEEEICTITKEVFPKFVDFLADEKCDKKQNIIKLINQFLQDHYKIMKQSIDLGKYLRNVMQLADTDDLDMQKYICHTFVMYVEYREECLLPHLHDVIMYLLIKTQHEDLEVALGACEFWLAVTKLSNCKEILAPYVDKLIPVLLKNMKYSTFELIALKDTLRVDEQSDDRSKETFPFHMHDKRITREDDQYEEDYAGNCDDVDDFYVGWTLRKCSAASLDAIAVKFGEDVLPLVVPFLNELLYHQDFLIKESAILALGAISEGCMNGLKPHLPYLIEYLIHTMNDDHSMVRVITCWTLSRYVGWIINSQPSHSIYFIPVMTILLKHFMDDNKRVQRAAISAFCVFQEEAQMQLIPYIDLILEGFQLGFQKFNYRSLYLLYDAINVLALAVGNELSKPEYVEKLMPPIMQKLNEYNNYSDDQFIAVLECLANIIPSLDAGFLPYSEAIYSQCMEIIMDTFMADANFQENLNGYDPPDKEPMHVALDVLYSMAVGLKSYFYKYVTNSNLVCLLYTTMQDCSFLIRQSSIALYGELVLICYPYLSTNVGDYIKLIIKNLDECYEGVCKNAAWVIGKLTAVMGAEIRPFVPDILPAFVNILRNPIVSRAMHQTVSVALCTLCCVCPDASIGDSDTVLKNCCMSLRSLKDSDEKDLAFRGLCQAVVRHPDFCQNNFMYFCDAVASWNSVKPDLKQLIKNILVSFKEQCGEMNWMQFYGQFPELLKLQLYNLKCPQSLIAPLIQIVIDETRKCCKKQPTACGFNPSDNAYEPLKLMQTVMAKTNEICLRYLDNSMLCSLPSPGHLHHVVSVCAAKNKRRRMEDRHVVVHDLNTMFNIQEASPSSYYAIFDGHAGHDAAAYSAAHLHQFLAESKHFVANPEQALLDAFCKTDALFIDKCNVERFNSGTTAVCALLRPKEKTLYIAWVGDSQALLVNQGRVLQCVNPHKPCRVDERERIEKQGGYVCYWGTWRVNGQLAVSRAIGDAEYKPYVIAVPDIREIPLDGGEDFLILACDGLWDFLSEDDAAKTVYNMVCQCPEKTDLISEHLVYLAKERGSADNISVIVVFLREPSKIAAEAHWANRNAPAPTMDASLDNNNPFANSNGADNGIIPQKTTTTDALLLNLSENYKHNGGATAGDFYHNIGEKANGKRLASEFLDEDDDDLGPETDVDAVDDALSPSIMQAKALADGIVNNNPDFNPFAEKEEVEKAALEIDLDLQKQQSSEFDGQRSPREETPTPPADAVHDGGLEENVGDSGGEESEEEDEWNYIKGEEANKENVSPSQPDCEVADLLEEADNMSQLNPNAAEFVPVSPTRSIPSPACRAMLNDPVIAQSPKRPSDIDINLPNPQEFESEVKSRPSDFDSYSNGHDHEGDEKQPTSQELMENLLNGKNIDEIPEFQPTPTKATSEEFHFGPNAAPFTPAKLLDQSEASTKAVYGDDESALTFDSTFDASKDNVDFLMSTIKKDDEDPMSMSFYQEKTPEGGDGVESFDLNKVQMLPENLDDFLNKTEDQLLNVQDETISNVTETSEKEVSSAKEETQQLVSDEILLNNDERIQTTDLDKMVDEEKELASPVSNEEDLISGVCELSSRSPRPEVVSESPLPPDPELVEVCSRPESKSSEMACSRPETKSPELVCSRPESKSPLEELSVRPESTEVVSPAVLSPEPAVSSPEPAVVSPVEPAPEEAAISPEPVQHLEPEVCVRPAEIASPEPEQQIPEPGVCSPVASPVEEAREESPELKVTSPEPGAESPLAQVSSPEPSEELCQLSSKSPQPPVEEEVQVKSSPEPVEEELLCKLEAKETSASIESPVEDVTSSVKDVASPVESPIPDQVVASESTVAPEVVVEKASSPVKDEPPSPGAPIEATPKSIADTESVLTAEMNSFLERSQLSDLTSPLSPGEQQQEHVMDPSHPLMTCVYPLPTTEIKTETIAPEFAEPATVLSPTEPSKEEEIPSSAAPEESAKEVEKSVVEPETAAAAAVAVAAAATAAVVAEKKTATKTAKKPPAKTASPTKSPAAAAKAKAAPPARTRPVTAPTAAKKTTTTSRTAPTAPKPAAPAPKPRTSATASKPPEKKPLTNGDLKKTTTTTTTRKSLDSPKTATTAKLSPANKTSPTKPTAPRPTTAPAKSPATRTTVAAKTRPNTLVKTTSSSVTATKTTTASQRLTAKTSTTSPKPTSPPKPRPATAPARPKAPVTKTVSKTSTDTEKQIKDSANKLTASRTVTSSKSTAATRTITSTTVRKTEAKTTGSSRTTTTKTTTTGSTSTRPGKKPAEITRTAKTTKITKTAEKPVENGVVTTEQILINNTVNERDQQELMKDNSPIDNKLIVETNTAD